ncbi:MAG: NUMOD3 domain-containing DNA-binding protein [Opitutaceae bacterium]
MATRTLAVYLIRSPGPDGKAYVGKDSHFPARMRDHERIAAKQGHKEFNAPVHRAIRKYGWKNMEVKAIDSRARSLKELARRERLWVWMFRAKSSGYNQTHGGEGTIGYVHTEAARQKVALARIGTKSSEATKAKIAAAGRLRRQTRETRAKIGAGNKGKVRSETSRLRVSQARRGRALSLEHRQAISKGLQWLKGRGREAAVRLKIKQSHIKWRQNEAAFTGPDGEQVVTKDIKVFAVANGLQTQKLYLMLNGGCRAHKGWTGRWLLKAGSKQAALAASSPKKVFLSRDEAMRAKRCIHVYELTDPAGRIWPLTNNLSAFCRANGLDQRKMSLVVKHRYGRNSHKGWTGRILTANEVSASGFRAV